MDKHATDDAAQQPADGPSASPDGGTARYPFRDPTLPIADRIADLLSLLTLEKKMALVNTGIGLPRLGIPETDNAEGIHGLVMAGSFAGGELDVPTTTFPQTIGMSHTWAPDLIQRAGAAVGREARYIAHSSAYGRSKLIVMAPTTPIWPGIHAGAARMSATARIPISLA